MFDWCWFNFVLIIRDVELVFFRLIFRMGQDLHVKVVRSLGRLETSQVQVFSFERCLACSNLHSRMVCAIFRPVPCREKRS